MISSTDRIEKELLLGAPLERVWRAISDAAAFGTWFGMELDGPFQPGATIIGRIRPTGVDPVVAQAQQKYAGTAITLVIDRVEPMRLLSYRWHPHALDPKVDYAAEPATLVTFTLEPVDGGTLLRIVESGFDSIPVARRVEAFEANDRGWSMQVRLVEKYLSQHP